jgi:hypothetical protein
MSENKSTKAKLNQESASQTAYTQEHQFNEINDRNPVVKAQKQISSQRTVGVYSPQQE